MWPSKSLRPIYSGARSIKYQREPRGPGTEPATVPPFKALRSRWLPEKFSPRFPRYACMP